MCKTVEELIQFQWTSYVRNFHLFFFLSYCFYMFVLLIYSNLVYLNDHHDEEGIPLKEKARNMLMLSIGSGIPVAYNLNQLYRLGFAKYFADAQNIIDLFACVCSVS